MNPTNISKHFMFKVHPTVEEIYQRKLTFQNISCLRFI